MFVCLQLGRFDCRVYDLLLFMALLLICVCPSVSLSLPLSLSASPSFSVCFSLCLFLYLNGSQPFLTLGPLDKFCLGSRTTRNNLFILSGNFSFCSIFLFSHCNDTSL